MNYIDAILLLITCLKLSKGVNSETLLKSPVAQLKRQVLEGYDSTVRPVEHVQNLTLISIAFYPRHISYDESANMLTAQTWIYMTWDDMFVKWNADSNDPQTLIVPSGEVWNPDLVVFNGPDSRLQEKSFRGNYVFISPSGKVTSFFRAQFSFHCKSDFSKWPYDVHTCKALMGSLEYGSKYLVFNVSQNTYTKSYLPDRNWKILKISSESRILTGTSAENAQSVIYYEFVFKRYSTIMTGIVTIPAAVLTVLILTTFWMDSGKIDRFILQIVVMIGQVSYLQFLGEVVPPNGKDSIIMVSYFQDSLILSCWALILTLIFRGIDTWGPVPNWLRQVNSGVQRLESYRFLSTKVIQIQATASNYEEESVPIVKSDTNKEEWIQICRFVDKLHFFIYLIVKIFSISFMLP